MVGVFKFRNLRIPFSQGFLSDTSPLGEMFFATPDLSVLVHEPGVGNMPKLTRDMLPGVVRLLAAFWL
jgi:hypothetical protein